MFLYKLYLFKFYDFKIVFICKRALFFNNLNKAMDNTKKNKFWLNKTILLTLCTVNVISKCYFFLSSLDYKLILCK